MFRNEMKARSRLVVSLVIQIIILCYTNHFKIIDNMTIKLGFWRARNLSLLSKCLIVKCLKVLSAIPNNTIFQFSSSVTVDIAKMKYRYYFWLQTLLPLISGTKKWEKDLNLKADFNWNLAFTRISKVRKAS